MTSPITVHIKSQTIVQLQSPLMIFNRNMNLIVCLEKFEQMTEKPDEAAATTEENKKR